ncbi:hypothetical protein CR513_06087, partial [Mucuna pruriens]
MNSINHGVYVRGTNGQLESDFYGNLSDIIQLEYTSFPIMKYNKAYDPFIFAQQAEQVYYTTYPEGHHSWLAVIKTKARSRIVNNTLPQIEQEAPYQDDDFVGLQVVLHIDLYIINESLVDIDSGGEEVDTQLLDQTEFNELNEDEYITIESEMIMMGKISDMFWCCKNDQSKRSTHHPTSINHISTLESTILIHQHVILATIEEEPQLIEVCDIVVTPSTLQDSFTSEGSSPHSQHTLDQKPFLEIYTITWSSLCDLMNN